MPDMTLKEINKILSPRGKKDSGKINKKIIGNFRDLGIAQKRRVALFAVEYLDRHTSISLDGLFKRFSGDIITFILQQNSDLPSKSAMMMAKYSDLSMKNAFDILEQKNINKIEVLKILIKKTRSLPVINVYLKNMADLFIEEKPFSLGLVLIAAHKNVKDSTLKVIIKNERMYNDANLTKNVLLTIIKNKVFDHNIAGEILSFHKKLSSLEIDDDIFEVLLRKDLSNDNLYVMSSKTENPEIIKKILKHKNITEEEIEFILIEQDNVDMTNEMLEIIIENEGAIQNQAIQDAIVESSAFYMNLYKLLDKKIEITPRHLRKIVSGTADPVVVMKILSGKDVTSDIIRLIFDNPNIKSYLPRILGKVVRRRQLHHDIVKLVLKEDKLELVDLNLIASRIKRDQIKDFVDVVIHPNADKTTFAQIIRNRELGEEAVLLILKNSSRFSNKRINEFLEWISKINKPLIRTFIVEKEIIKEARISVKILGPLAKTTKHPKTLEVIAQHRLFNRQIFDSIMQNKFRQIEVLFFLAKREDLYYSEMLTEILDATDIFVDYHDVHVEQIHMCLIKKRSLIVKDLNKIAGIIKNPRAFGIISAHPSCTGETESILFRNAVENNLTPLSFLKKIASESKDHECFSALLVHKNAKESKHRDQILKLFVKNPYTESEFLSIAAKEITDIRFFRKIFFHGSATQGTKEILFENMIENQRLPGDSLLIIAKHSKTPATLHRLMRRRSRNVNEIFCALLQNEFCEKKNLIPLSKTIISNQRIPVEILLFAAKEITDIRFFTQIYSHRGANQIVKEALFENMVKNQRLPGDDLTIIAIYSENPNTLHQLVELRKGLRKDTIQSLIGNKNTSKKTLRYMLKNCPIDGQQRGEIEGLLKKDGTKRKMKL